MQHQATCVNDDCDHFLAAPSERQVVTAAKEHSEETDHDVKVTGTYDSPRNGGVYRDGERLNMSLRERQEYEMERRRAV